MMRFCSTTAVVILFGILLFSACKSDDEQTVAEDPKAENRKQLGLSAEDLLSDDFYTSITIELAYPVTYRPTETTIANFRAFLEERLHKPEGIRFVETIIQAPTGAPFTLNDIKEIEDENREYYTTGTDIAVYVFFSNGASSNDSDTTVTLGTAYQNTSIVIYEKTIKSLANGNQNIDLSNLESSTWQHEFGHILGLVNIQSDDIHTTHEDPGHLKHCMVESCLMYFESSNGLLITNILDRNNGGIPTFDPLCIADLQAKGGK